MSFRNVVRRFCRQTDHTRHATPSGSVAHTLFPNITQYEMFSPDFESSSDFEDYVPQSEIVLPNVLSKKELYTHADEVATARKSGCAPIKRAQTLVRGLLHGRSQLKTSLSDSTVTLFNFHTTDLAEKLVNSNIRSLVLVESEHNYARNAKAFARAQRSLSRNVAAYRTELGVLLGISRKKVPAFPSHLLSASPKLQRTPFTLNGNGENKEPNSRSSPAPILVSALPIVSQQNSVLDALLNNLLLHYADIDEETLFSYGGVELVTFLSAAPLSRLLASSDQRMSFMSHAHRRYSALFFKLFNVELLRAEGFSRRSFAPPISMPKAIAHEKKLKELNIVNGLLYPVGIRPSSSVTLNSIELGTLNTEGQQMDSRCLLTFAHWMQIVGKQQTFKKTAAVLEQVCPESSSSALLHVDGDCPIGNVSTLDLEKVFDVVREELQSTKTFEEFKKALYSKRNSSNP